MPTRLQKGEVGQVTQSHRPEYDQKIHFLSQSVSDDGKPLMLTNLCDSFVFIQTAKWEEYSQTTIL